MFSIRDERGLDESSCVSYCSVMSESQAATDRLTVIVPFLNEAATLRTAIERTLKADLPVEVEVIAVDDGSTDGSADLIEDLIGEGSVILLKHPTSLGKGAGIRTALERASGDWVTIMDADLEYDPADLKPLMAPVVRGEADVVFGNRAFSGHTAFSFWYVIGNKVISLWASFLFDAWLSDVYTCLKIARLEDWRALELKQPGFGIEAEITGKLLARGYRIHEVPISYRARSRAEGKKVTWRDGLAAMWILTRIRLRRNKWSKSARD
jgi:glycosyltransferase involved in cell wall biosynthesis